MARHQLWLDNISNNDVGVVVGELTISAPEPDVNTVHVPGRNGDLHIYTGAYKNRRGQANAHLYAKYGGVKTAISNAQKWLIGTPGYRRLETDDDPYYFMKARVINGAEIAARMDKLAPFTIQLDLAPQRYLKAGEIPTIIYQSGTLTNATSYDAEPFYEITGDGTVTIKINDQSITVQGLGINGISRTMYFDAETGNAYTPDVANANNRVETTGDLKLKPGENIITITGNLESVKITPRWWEL
jgi:phage-related protein